MSRNVISIAPLLKIRRCIPGKACEYSCTIGCFARPSFVVVRLGIDLGLGYEESAEAYDVLGRSKKLGKVENIFCFLRFSGDK